MTGEQATLTADIVVLDNTVNLTERTQHVLLIQRKKAPFQDMWALPGGKLEQGETFEQAALRELSEETGIEDIRNLQSIGYFADPERDPRGRSVSCAFKGYVFGDSPEVQCGSDASNARWFPLNGLPPLAFDHIDIIAKVKPMHYIAWLQEMDEMIRAYASLVGSLPEDIPAGLRDSIEGNITSLLVHLRSREVHLKIDVEHMARFSYKYQGE